MTLAGPTIIAQFLQYNSHIRRRVGSITSQHNKDKYTPVSVYLGLTVHAKARRRDFVDTLFHLGLSISYDRVMSMTTSLGNMISDICELLIYMWTVDINADIDLYDYSNKRLIDWLGEQYHQ